MLNHDFGFPERPGIAGAVDFLSLSTRCSGRIRSRRFGLYQRRDFGASRAWGAGASANNGHQQKGRHVPGWCADPSHIATARKLSKPPGRLTVPGARGPLSVDLDRSLLPRLGLPEIRLIGKEPVLV